jgi:hypothetical protein
MSMIPAGYLYKKVVPAPDFLDGASVVDVYSVSGCISEPFADYIGHWRHNGFWLFDTPQVMGALAHECGVALAPMTLFYYEVFEKAWDEGAKAWIPVEPEASIATDVAVPKLRELAGYDVVTFSGGSAPECSPLSCNGLSKTLSVNQHCLFDSAEDANSTLASGEFVDTEPGPFRVFAVYRLDAESINA